MDGDFSARRGPSADDLLILLAVAEKGRYVAAAEALGLNHTTISRRVAALEAHVGEHLLSRSAGSWELTDAGRRVAAAARIVDGAVNSLIGGPDALSGIVRMSATDGFSAFVVPPAVAGLCRSHPELSVEVVTVTRAAAQQRIGLDLEVVVGKPQVRRAQTFRLADYCLGMYASRRYLSEHGAPASIAEVREHPLVYFIDSMLEVDVLDAATRLVPGMHDGLSSTNVFVHVEATRAGAGIGLLPCFMADRHDDLVRLLPDELNEVLSYWVVVREDALRRRSVAALLDALSAEVHRRRDELLGA